MADQSTSSGNGPAAGSGPPTGDCNPTSPPKPQEDPGDGAPTGSAESRFPGQSGPDAAPQSDTQNPSAGEEAKSVGKVEKPGEGDEPSEGDKPDRDQKPDEGDKPDQALGEKLDQDDKPDPQEVKADLQEDKADSPKTSPDANHASATASPSPPVDEPKEQPSNAPDGSGDEAKNQRLDAPAGSGNEANNNPSTSPDSSGDENKDKPSTSPNDIVPKEAPAVVTAPAIVPNTLAGNGNINPVPETPPVKPACKKAKKTTKKKPELVPRPTQTPTLPSWFLERNVLTHLELLQMPTHVRLYNPSSGVSPAPSASGPSSDFQIHTSMYEEAVDILASAMRRPPVTEAHKKRPLEAWIQTAGFLIQCPKEGSLDFLDEVVQLLARDLCCDLIKLDADDFEDLCHEFWRDVDPVKTMTISKNLEPPAQHILRSIFGHMTPMDQSNATTTAILNAVELKNKNKSPKEIAAAAEETNKAYEAATDMSATCTQTPAAESQADSDEISSVKAQEGLPMEQDDGRPPPEDKPFPPLILLFRNIDSLEKCTPPSRLREGVAKLRREQGRAVVLIGTAVSSDMATNRIAAKGAMAKMWDALALDPSEVITVAPRHTRRATAAMARNSSEMQLLRSRWRQLRRAVLGVLVQHPTVNIDALMTPSPELAVPAGEWDISVVSRVVRRVCGRAVLTGSVTIEDIFEALKKTDEALGIVKGLVTAGEEDFEDDDDPADAMRDAAVSLSLQSAKLYEAKEEEEAQKPSKVNVKLLLDSISHQCSSAEKLLFSCVVDTDAVGSTAEDIRIDQGHIDSLSQLLALRLTVPYGLLARESINGAILYGPPGTGKTHLARVVAATVGTNLIVATPADIEDKYVGESEKRIKALFSLATRLAPCLLFIDEGDAVLGRREGRSSYSRKMLSQFLTEMDGLVGPESGRAPFMLVATNRPGDIDDAICRRMPHMLHVGMPTVADRRAILDIFLRDEKLGPDVDLDVVASDAMTKGFSGSDIKALCVQAAMAAHWELELSRQAKEKELKEKESQYGDKNEQKGGESHESSTKGDDGCEIKKTANETEAVTDGITATTKNGGDGSSGDKGQASQGNNGENGLVKDNVSGRTNGHKEDNKLAGQDDEKAEQVDKKANQDDAADTKEIDVQAPAHNGNTVADESTKQPDLETPDRNVNEKPEQDVEGKPEGMNNEKPETKADEKLEIKADDDKSESKADDEKSEAKTEEEKSVDDKEDTPKRVITMEHFKKALTRCRPSVTRESLMAIESFTGEDDSKPFGMYI